MHFEKLSGFFKHKSKEAFFPHNELWVVARCHTDLCEYSTNVPRTLEAFQYFNVSKSDQICRRNMAARNYLCMDERRGMRE